MFTGILLVVSIYGWYTLEWGYGLLFVFLTAVVSLMMMIYKELDTQVFKDRFYGIIIIILLW